MRGSGDTVDTIVVHSPSMRGVAEQELDTEEPPVDSAAAPEGPASPAAADHSVSLARADGVGNTPMLDSPVVSHPLGEPSGETSVGPASPASLQGDLGAQLNSFAPDDAEVQGEDAQTEMSPSAAAPVATPAPSTGLSSVDVPASPVMQPPVLTFGDENLKIAAETFEFDTAMAGTPVAFAGAEVPQTSQDAAQATAGLEEPQSSLAVLSDVEMAGCTPVAHAVRRSASVQDVSDADVTAPPHDDSETIAPPALQSCSVTGGFAAAESGEMGVSPAPACAAKPADAEASYVHEATPSPPPCADTSQAAPASCSSAERTPPQSQQEAVGTPDSTPIGVVLARCRAELEGGQEALGGVDSVAPAESVDDDVTETGTGAHPTKPGSSGMDVDATEAACEDTGAVGAAEQCDAMPGTAAAHAEADGACDVVSPGGSEGADVVDDADMTVAVGGDNTVEVRHGAGIMDCEDEAKVTPPLLGSQDAVAGSATPHDEDDRTCMQSPAAQEARLVASGGICAENVDMEHTRDGPGTPCDGGDGAGRRAGIEIELSAGMVAEGYDGADDTTDSEMLRTSSAWRSVQTGASSQLCCPAVRARLALAMWLAHAPSPTACPAQSASAPHAAVWHPRQQ